MTICQLYFGGARPEGPGHTHLPRFQGLVSKHAPDIGIVVQSRRTIPGYDDAIQGRMEAPRPRWILWRAFVLVSTLLPSVLQGGSSVVSILTEQSATTNPPNADAYTEYRPQPLCGLPNPIEARLLAEFEDRGHVPHAVRMSSQSASPLQHEAGVSTTTKGWPFARRLTCDEDG